MALAAKETNANHCATTTVCAGRLSVSAKHKWLSLDAHGQLEVSNVLQRHYNLKLFLAPRHCSLQVFLALCHQQTCTCANKADLSTCL